MIESKIIKSKCDKCGQYFEYEKYDGICPNCGRYKSLPNPSKEYEQKLLTRYDDDRWEKNSKYKDSSFDRSQSKKSSNYTESEMKGTGSSYSRKQDSAEYSSANDPENRKAIFGHRRKLDASAQPGKVQNWSKRSKNSRSVNDMEAGGHNKIFNLIVVTVIIIAIIIVIAYGIFSHKAKTNLEIQVQTQTQAQDYILEPEEIILGESFEYEKQSISTCNKLMS